MYNNEELRKFVFLKEDDDSYDDDYDEDWEDEIFE